MSIGKIQEKRPPRGLGVHNDVLGCQPPQKKKKGGPSFISLGKNIPLFDGYLFTIFRYLCTNSKALGMHHKVDKEKDDFS